MKILILSCNTGGGHNSCGKYIKEEFESDMCGIHLNPRMYLKYEYYIGNRMKAIINSFSGIILMPNHLRRRLNVQQQQEDS